MALEDYKRKRDFTKTPEPAGEKVVKKKKGEELFFCVQKHLASHLHYDFRLEWNGVLLSWAVPKGPSLNPADKRLAMQTEDHPFDYGTFEGVIPEGYGAGIVMLWDQGTWTPENDDVDAALRKGDLKFTLDGFKLKGSWVLVRTGGRYAARGGGVVEGHRGEHVAVVGDGHGLHAHAGRLLHELVDVAGPVQQAVLGVEVQVDELRHSHSIVDGGLLLTS